MPKPSAIDAGRIAEVSVAVCSYNGARFIEAQLRSIMEQTRPPDEIVVCDDGSTDGTMEIVRSLAGSSSIPIDFHLNERTLGVTRNFENAIGRCSGDIVFLADQDDVWFPDKVERMLEAFVADASVGLAYCDAIITDGSLEPAGMTVFDTRGISQVWKGSGRDPRDVLKRPNIKGCTMAVVRDLVAKALPIPEKDGRPIWSHDYWIAFALHCLSRVVALDRPLMYYRVHGGNASGLLKKSDDAIRREERTYRSRFSSARIRERAALYERMLEFVHRIIPEGISRLPGAEIPFGQALAEDRALFESRMKIWETRDPARRAALIARFLARGGYARFKRSGIQPFRDAFGSAG